MAEHRVKKNEIIYIIPTDELFLKLKNDEAFIDDYGRLMNRKPHRVLKELKYYVANDPTVQQKAISPSATPDKKNSPEMEYLKDTVRDRAIEVKDEIIDRIKDKFFYEVLPGVWHEHIVPFYHRTTEALTAKELKIDAIQLQTSETVVAKPKPNAKMTKEEADAEKRKILYHWLGLLDYSGSVVKTKI